MRDNEHERDGRRSLSETELDHQRLDAELLAEWVGRQLLRNPEHPAWSDERFLAWLAVEARAQAERDVRFSERAARVRGEQFMARALAKRLRMVREHAAPSFDTRPPAMLRKETRAKSREHAAPMIQLGAAAGVGREIWDMEVDAWAKLPPEVPAGRYVVCPIEGESMAPVMHTGDKILVRLETDVKRNTAIVARHPEDGYVCKQVLHVRRDTIVLGSIEPGRPPITIPRDPRLIVGTVVLVWCTHYAQKREGRP